MLRLIGCEKKTWRLLTSLYRDRMESEATADDDDAMMVDDVVSCVRPQHGRPLHAISIVFFSLHMHWGFY